MAANDHLSPQQFYHGTSQDLIPGKDMIEPGHTPNYDLSEPGHVYFDDHPGAAEWGGENAHLYEVHPTGDYEEDLQSTGYKSQSPLRIHRKVF